MKAPRLTDRGLVVQRAALLVRPGSVRSRPFGATLAPDVWHPVVLADLVLRSVEIGLFVLAWTDESLAEVEREMAAHRRRPTMAPDDILDRLDALGLSAMVGVLRQSDFDSAG